MRIAVAVDTETIGHGTLDKGAMRLLADVTTLGFYLLNGYGFYIVVATNKEGGTAEGTGVVMILPFTCCSTRTFVNIFFSCYANQYQACPNIHGYNLS